MHTQGIALREKFESLSGSLCITDPSGKMLYTNKAIRRRTGYEAAEVVGKTPSKLWGGHMPRAFYDHLWHIISERKEPFVGRVHNMRKDGSMHEEVIHIAPVFGAARTITYFVEVHPDVRDRGQEHAFQQEFIRIMQKNQVSGSGAVDWVSYWLAGETHTLSCEDMHGSFSEILDNCFVAPTREQFADRYKDKTLIEQAKANPTLFGDIYEKYYQRIFHYFLGRVYTRSLAEDLAQETFIRAFRHLQFFRHTNASYYTYLLRISHNLLVNVYRKKTVEHLDKDAQEKIQAPEIHEKLWGKEIVWKAVGRLSTIEARVLTLMYKEGCSIKEIATMLDKTDNAVKLHVSRARKKLKYLLKK